MSIASVLRGVGNKVYEHAFPIYRPLYGAYKSYADHAERQLLRRILVPGDVAVDVGANIGIYTQFLSRCVGPTGLVHSFEPSSENFRRLQAATRKLPNVRLSQSAIGESSCRSTLYVSDKLNVDHRAYLPDGDSHHTVPIEMVALDDYFKPGERVDLLKLDVQGYELHALQGARRIVNENREIKLLLEFWPYGLKQAGASWGELIEMLEGFAMNIMFVRTDGLIPFEARKVRTDVNWYVNLFASRSVEVAVTA